MLAQLPTHLTVRAALPWLSFSMPGGVTHATRLSDLWSGKPNWMNQGKMRRKLKWTVIACGGYGLAELAEPLQLPASFLIVPLVFGVVLAVSGLVSETVPRTANRSAQALIGVLMGTYLTPGMMRRFGAAALPLTVITAATVALSLVGALVLVRTAGMDRATATLGMVAGGSSAVVACAEDLKADSRLVAFMQYTRVALVAATAPFIVSWMFAGRHAPTHSVAEAVPYLTFVSSHDQITGLVLAIAVAIVGIRMGERLRLPSPVLLGPMLLATIVTFADQAHRFAPDGVLRAALFTAIGLDVGLRFSRHTLRHVWKLLPIVLVCTIAMSVATGLLAWALSALMRIPLADAYLATTPGGINAVLASAVTSGANVGLVSSVQSLRLFLMMALIPLVKLWFTHSRGRGGGATGEAATTRQPSSQPG
jgi:membrane AbrB-like protein